MKKSRFSDDQIVGILKQADAGVPVSALCREYGISSATFYKWRDKYRGVGASLMGQMKQGAKQAAELCNSLSNANRLLILCTLIEKKGMSSGDLSREIELSPSATSQHLAKMRDAKLVACTRNKQSVIYSIQNTKIEKIIMALKDVFCP
ncbi:MAG: metalloregulator ArsR/SmtB family transcription factor [Burkholderiales bacterium]|nr:metalloregulator ArsR/SmtB family transcription factor [Burkholderiales bacterium]